MCVAGPKKPSLPSSRSKVPAGRSAWAWREVSPARCGRWIQRRLMASSLSFHFVIPAKSPDQVRGGIQRHGIPSLALDAFATSGALLIRREHATRNLILLDGFEQGAEIALAE